AGQGGDFGEREEAQRRVPDPRRAACQPLLLGRRSDYACRSPARHFRLSLFEQSVHRTAEPAAPRCLVRTAARAPELSEVGGRTADLTVRNATFVKSSRDISE